MEIGFAAHGGYAPQQRLRALIAAVLRPHSAEHAQFDRVRRAAEPGHDGVILLACQRHLAEHGIGNIAVSHQLSAISLWLAGSPPLALPINSTALPTAER